MEKGDGIVTCVSSFRALADNSEVAFNQILAKESWNKVFGKIILFGAHEPKLESFQTEFVDTGDFPKIQMLALAASLSDSMTCLINADIVVASYLIPVLQDVERKGGQCATSHRYEFDPRNPDYDKAKVVDNGIDFFCAYPDLWKIIVREVPTEYRLGHCRWDSWMMGFFNTMRPRAFYDITSRRCFFHPKHESRKRVYEIPNLNDKYTGNCGFPRLKL